MLFRIADPVGAVVENRRAEDRVRPALRDRLAEVVELAGASGSDHRHTDGLRDRSGQLDVIAVGRAVAIHAREQDLAGPPLGGLPGPLDRLAVGEITPPVYINVPPPVIAPLRVDGDDDALSAEHLRELVDQLGPGERRRVDRDLVGAGVEHRLRVIDRANATPDREWYEHVVCRPPRQLDDCVALLVRRGDIEKYELVRALLVVACGELDRVARIAQADEVRSLDDSAAIDIEARDDTLQDHQPSVADGPWPPASTSFSFS